jgi:hypothetical protein
MPVNIDVGRLAMTEEATSSEELNPANLEFAQSTARMRINSPSRSLDLIFPKITSPINFEYAK